MLTSKQATKIAKIRWGPISKEKRLEHSVMMNKKRWGKLKVNKIINNEKSN